MAAYCGRSGQRGAEARVPQAGDYGNKASGGGSVYPEQLEKLGIGCVCPTKQQRERINNIIFYELVRGVQSLESLFYMQQTMNR